MTNRAHHHGSTGDASVDRLLDSYSPPSLPAAFGDDVMARLAAREAQEPPLVARRHSRARQIWGRSSRAIIGSAVAGLMTATAAAAAGVFGDFGVTIPAWQRTVERVTGLELAKTETPPLVAAPATTPRITVDEVAAPIAKPTLREIVADGKISTRAELEAAGEAIDARRNEQRTQRRARIEEQVAAHLERRRAQGLPVPSAEEQAAIRARIEARLAERDAAASERRSRFRDKLGERIDAGEEIELRPPVVPADGATPPTHWRDLTPAERRAQWRERRLREPAQDELTSANEGQ